MLFRFLLGEKSQSTPTATDELRGAVAAAMPGADAESAAIVGAVAGLCAIVAFVDREYAAAERVAVRELLGKVHGLPSHAVDGVCALLEARIAELAHESLQTCTRVLYERTERGARVEVLDMLMDLAAADEAVSTDETNMLRRIATGLGLSENEYISSQSRYRERLSILKLDR